jgi:hypothetical protein
MDEEVIPILRVSDAAAAVAWYERLSFTKEWEHRFEPGLPAFVTIARDRMRLFLSEHRGDARPDTLVYLRVRDVDAIAEEFGASVEQASWARERSSGARVPRRPRTADASRAWAPERRARRLASSRPRLAPAIHANMSLNPARHAATSTLGLAATPSSSNLCTPRRIHAVAASHHADTPPKITECGSSTRPVSVAGRLWSAQRRRAESGARRRAARSTAARGTPG